MKICIAQTRPVKGNINANISRHIEMIGSNEKMSWEQYPYSLVIEKPKAIPNGIAVVFKVLLQWSLVLYHFL